MIEVIFNLSGLCSLALLGTPYVMYWWGLVGSEGNRLFGTWLAICVIGLAVFFTTGSYLEEKREEALAVELAELRQRLEQEEAAFFKKATYKEFTVVRVKNYDGDTKAILKDSSGRRIAEYVPDTTLKGDIMIIACQKDDCRVPES